MACIAYNTLRSLNSTIYLTIITIVSFIYVSLLRDSQNTGNDRSPYDHSPYGRSTIDQQAFRSNFIPFYRTQNSTSLQTNHPVSSSEHSHYTDPPPGDDKGPPPPYRNDTPPPKYEDVVTV